MSGVQVPGTVVVVGASLAGVRVARGLRARGWDGELVLVGAERHLPYDRPPLSKQVLSGAWPPARARLLDDDAVTALRADLRLGRRAVSVVEREVRLDDGTRVRADAVVAATGASPRRLPGQPADPRVTVLRDLDDCVALSGVLTTAGSLLVVGGGLIGGEVASAARERGLEVTVVEAAPTPFRRALGERAGRLLAEVHRDAGVRWRTATGVVSWSTDGPQVEALLDDGSRVVADHVLVAVGAAPVTGWLEGLGLDLRDGLRCDGTGRAEHHDWLWGAGDVAAWLDPVDGLHRRAEHWTSTVEQGELVADALLGRDAEPAARLPYAWTDQGGLKVQVVGRPGDADTELVVAGGPEARGTCVVGVRAGRVVATTTFGLPRALAACRGLVGAGATADEAREALAAAPVAR